METMEMLCYGTPQTGESKAVRLEGETIVIDSPAKIFKQTKRRIFKEIVKQTK